MNIVERKKIAVSKKFNEQKITIINKPQRELQSGKGAALGRKAVKSR